MAVLIAGAYFTLTILGIAGFVIMLGSATMALTSLRGSTAPSESARPGAESAGKGGFTVIEGGRSKRRTPRLRGHSPAPPAPSWSGWKSAGAVVATSAAASEPSSSRRLVD